MKKNRDENSQKPLAVEKKRPICQIGGFACIIYCEQFDRAGSVSVFQVGVGYRLFFGYFFQVGRFSVSVFIKISVSVSVSVFYAAQFT
jgi:hypothetical protein